MKQNLQPEPADVAVRWSDAPGRRPVSTPPGRPPAAIHVDVIEDDEPDVLEGAAWWAHSEPGWIERVLGRHKESFEGSGACGTCSGHQSVKWPCVLRSIAEIAQALVEQAEHQGAVQSLRVAA